MAGVGDASDGFPDYDEIGPGTVVNPTTIKLDDYLNLELEILAKIQQRANQIHNVWINDYLPCELDTLNRVSSRPKLTVDIDTTAATAMNGVSQSFAVAIQNSINFSQKNCIYDGCGPWVRLHAANIRAQSWQVQGDLRYEEGRTSLENAQRLNDRIAMISPGRNGVVQANNSLLAASRILGDLARQGEAAKGGSSYAAGRVLEFAKGNIGNLAKLFQGNVADTAQQSFRTQELEAQSAGQGLIDLPIDTTINADPYAGGYQYDSGADLYSAPMVEAPAVTASFYTAPEF
jgi:hypothetical protein